MISSIIGGTTLNKDGNSLPLVGSWKYFNKQISCSKFQKTLIRYIPIIPELVNYFAVLKSYIYFFVKRTENIEIKHIFSHCDKAAYSKLSRIIWKHSDEFSKVIPLVDGFHQVLAFVENRL